MHTSKAVLELQVTAPRGATAVTSRAATTMGTRLASRNGLRLQQQFQHLSMAKRESVYFILVIQLSFLLYMCHGYIPVNLIKKEHDRAVFKLFRFVWELFGSVLNTAEWLCLNSSNTSGSILGCFHCRNSIFINIYHLEN